MVTSSLPSEKVVAYVYAKVEVKVDTGLRRGDNHVGGGWGLCLGLMLVIDVPVFNMRCEDDGCVRNAVSLQFSEVFRGIVIGGDRHMS